MYLAEYFPRLDSVTVSIDDVSPQAKFSFDPVAAVAKIDDVSIPLPTGRLQSNEVKLVKCNADTSNGSLSLTLKVPPSAEYLDDLAASFMNYSVPSLSNTSFVQKWSVQDLKNKTPQDKASRSNEFLFVCRQCKTQILDSSGSSFFDMPSELWLEMMEFWHCHKPNENLQNLEEKPYYKGIIKPGKANERIVGNYYVLIRVDVAEGAPVTHSEHACVCSSCQHELGQYLKDISIPDGESYYRINKWELELQYKRGPELEQCIELYLPYLYVYNLIMDKTNSVAIRKFYVNNSLFIWVLNIGISISTGGQVYRNALKLATREFDSSSPNEELDESNVEVLEIPTAVFAELKAALEKVHSSLPLANRKMTLRNGDKEFIEYKVSYLPSN